VERVGGDSGTTSHHRLRLHYAAGRGPERVFAKLPSADRRARLFTAALGLGAREVRFYDRVRPDLPLEAPRAFFAAARGTRFALLLEDLEAAGCRFPAPGTPLPPTAVPAVLAGLARLHARFRESPRFAQDLAWVPGPPRGARGRLERWLSARSHAPTLARFGDVVPEAVRRHVGAVHARRLELEEIWADAPATLLHGDPHPGNLYLRGDVPGFLDWQVLRRGDGLRDVTYFLVFGLPPEERRAREHALLAGYLGELAACGVPAPEPEAAFERHRLHALYAWIAASVTAATAGLQPGPVVRRAVAHAAQAVHDLDALGALREAAGPARRASYGRGP